MSQKIDRRTFSKTTVAAATAVSAVSLAPGRVLGANERVRLGFIGVGNRGCQLLKGFLAHPDAQVVALCDVYEPYLHGAYDRLDPRFDGLGKRSAQMPKIEGDVARVKDFRAVLDRKDIDAVVIATPDHWHAIQMIAACKAGKDVYVEKPLSMTVVEGRAMVEAARKYDRIVQVGTHRRSSRMYAQLAEVVRSGATRQGHRGAPRSATTWPPPGSAMPPNPHRRPVSTGTSGSARGRRGRSRRRSCPTSSAGGISTRRRWRTGASITST